MNRNRAAIVVSANLRAWSVPEFTCCDTVTIAFNGDTGAVWFSSVYMPGDTIDPPPVVVRGLIQHCESRGIPLIIGCDSNAHNIVWNSTDNNERGEALWEYLLSTNMEVCNRGHESTFVTANRREVLDLTLASTSISNSVTNWYVDPFPSLSDYRCIRFQLMGGCSQVQTRRNVRKTDWNHYETRCQQVIPRLELGNLNGSVDLNEAASSLTRAINDAYEESCPMLSLINI